MVGPDLPPQSRKVALYAAGGGFGGALLAIVVAKILAGDCCCTHKEPEVKRYQPAAVSEVIDTTAATDRIRAV